MTSSIQRNNVKILGSGSVTMVLAHGFGCDQNMWRLVTPAFEKDYRILLFDHVGAGHSDLTQYNVAKYASLQGYADDLLEIIDGTCNSPVIFVGHSVSAMIGRPQVVAMPPFVHARRAESIARWKRQTGSPRARGCRAACARCR